MRSTLAILIILALSFSLLIGQLNDCVRNAKSAGADEVTMFEQRFAGVKKDLPAYGTIGYVTNIGEGAFKQYTLTVYTLCPVMPVPDTASNLIVGNFAAARGWKVPDNTPFRVLRDYRNGVVLFQRTHP